jgi:hypothetical protein
MYFVALGAFLLMVPACFSLAGAGIVGIVGVLLGDPARSLEPATAGSPEPAAA